MFERIGAAWRALRGANLPAIRNQGETFSITDLERMLDIFQITPTASGMHVNSRTSVRVAAVYACVRLIAGAIATLPLPVYRSGDQGTREREWTHPLNSLLNEQPTPLCTASMFWDYVVTCKLLRGDGIALILRNVAAQITEFLPLDPNFVLIERRGNRLTYFTDWGPDAGNQRYVGFDQDDVLHFPGFGWDLKRMGSGILRGMSVISHAAHQAIGNALAMDDYSGRFFANGANPAITIESPGKMDEEQIGRLRSLWERLYAGNVNARKPLILTEGLKANPISVSAVDAQLLEARQYEVVDIARAFGIPPVLIGAMEKTSAWGTGIEQLAIAFVQFALQSHLTQIQQEINRKSFGISRYFVEFNVNGLMRGDAKSRSEWYRAALGGAQGPGWMTPNEVRRFENLPKDPDPKSDKLFVPAAKSDNAQSGADNAQAAA